MYNFLYVLAYAAYNVVAAGIIAPAMLLVDLIFPSPEIEHGDSDDIDFVEVPIEQVYNLPKGTVYDSQKWNEMVDKAVTTKPEVDRGV